MLTASLGIQSDLAGLKRLARFAKCDIRAFFHQLQLWYQGSLRLSREEERRIPELSLGLGAVDTADTLAWCCHQEESLIAADTWCAERRLMPLQDKAGGGSDNATAAAANAVVTMVRETPAARGWQWLSTVLCCATSAVCG